MEKSERCKDEGKLIRDLWTWETTQQQGIILTPHPADEGNPVPSFMTLTQPCNRSWPRDTDSSLNQNTTNTRQNWEPWQVWWIESHADNSRQRKCTHSPEVTSPTKRSEVAVRHWQGDPSTTSSWPRSALHPSQAGKSRHCKCQAPKGLSFLTGLRIFSPTRDTGAVGWGRNYTKPGKTSQSSLLKFLPHPQTAPADTRKAHAINQADQNSTAKALKLNFLWDHSPRN